MHGDARGCTGMHGDAQGCSLVGAWYFKIGFSSAEAKIPGSVYH